MRALPGEGGAVRAILVVALMAVSGCGNRPLREPGGRASSTVDAAPVAPARPAYADAATSGEGGAVGPTATGGAGGAAGDLGPGAFGGRGEAGQAGAAGPPGPGGSGDAPPPPPSLCDGMVQRPLPYAVANDFTNVLVLNAYASWSVLGQPGDCNQTVFPDLAVDGGADAGVASSADGGVDAGAAPGADSTVVSSCTAFVYNPDACVAANVDPTTAGAACWAGAIFEATPNGPNAPGICIAPGAHAIHFKARASREGARVKFGSIRAGLDATEFFLSLTTAWADYTVSIPDGEDYDDESGSPYGGVWDGFSVVAEPQDHVGGTYIFVSDVVWVAY
jgi:hypothetical protein